MYYYSLEIVIVRSDYMNIIKAFGTTNTDYYSKTLQRKYIVLHYTAGTRSVKGSARNVASMFKNGSVGGSADFIVDDSEIVQYNGDISHRACWSVGGKKYSSMTTSEGGRYYGICTNSNSINIEMCSNKVNTKNLGANDTDWYLTEATINNAVELTKYLMKQYNIPVENVIMHHHITGKVCPNPWCVNKSRLSKWQEFKSRLEEKIMKQNIKINGKIKTVDAINKDGYTYIKIRGLSDILNIGYDKETKLITVSVK